MGAAKEAGPSEITFSKNAPSLGCPKGTTGAPTSHPFLRHLISLLPIPCPPTASAFNGILDF